MENLIQSIESQKTTLEQKMLDPEFFKQGDQAKKAIQEHLAVENKLAHAMKEWLEIMELLKNSDDAN